MPWTEQITKAEIVAAIRDYVARTGRVPSLPQLQKYINNPLINRNTVHNKFGSYRNALAAAGFEHRGAGVPAGMRRLFLDWAALVRALGRIPTVGEYDLQSSYSIRPLIRRCGVWSAVPARMLDFARKERLARDWKDVVQIIQQHLAASQPPAASPKKSGSPSRSRRSDARPPVPERPALRSRPALPSRAPLRSRPRPVEQPPTYGVSLSLTPLAFAPCNEDGVLFLFGALAERLGFAVLRIQPGFPDCEAMREVSPGRLRRVRIEFEYESLNFLRHLHPIKGADIIVCWRHNWDACPLEVIELRKVLEGWKEKVGR
ncbi:MAG TPA: hypothetical protein VIB39_10505 [Candidatus Angelobacter sp.]